MKRRKRCPHYCNGYCFWRGDTGEVCDTGNNSHEGYCPMAESDRELEEIAEAMMKADEEKRNGESRN